MRLSALALVVFVAACGDDGGSAPVDAGPDAAAPNLLDPPPEGEGGQLGLDVPVAAGEEVTYCQYVTLDQSYDVSRFEHRYSEGSHHLLLFQTTFAEADVATWDRFECGSAQLPELGVRGIAYAAQVPEGELAYPSGVALKLAAGDIVLLQAHYLNTTDALIDAEVRLNLWKSTVAVEQEAGTMFFYDWAIYVPADGTASASMHCEIPADVTLIYAMSHMHKRGVGYASQLTGGALPAPMPLFETTSWEDIEPNLFDPSLQLTAGQAIDFRCDFQNTGGDPIMEGPSAEANEMCMFIAAYWPKLDPSTELCNNPGSGPRFEGTTTCAESLSCSTAAGDDLLAAEQCLVDTCAGSSEAVADFGNCVFNLCNEVCAGAGGDSCNECVINNCIDQYGACQQATCE